MANPSGRRAKPLGHPSPDHPLKRETRPLSMPDSEKPHWKGGLTQRTSRRKRGDSRQDAKTKPAWWNTLSSYLSLSLSPRNHTMLDLFRPLADPTGGRPSKQRIYPPRRQRGLQGRNPSMHRARTTVRPGSIWSYWSATFSRSE